MEYQAIDLQTGARVFHYGPVHGTNNIGEFLAIVHALALCWNQGLHDKTIYSDSYNAILWVSKRKCKTKLEHTPATEPLFQVIARETGMVADTQLSQSNCQVGDPEMG